MTLGELVEGRSGSRVAVERPEDIELNTSVVRLVEASSGNTTAQLRSSRALNLEVDALRVRLGAIGLTSSVQRDDLVANNVVTRRKVGNSKIPGKVVFNEIISSPGAGVAS